MHLMKTSFVYYETDKHFYIHKALDTALFIVIILCYCSCFEVLYCSVWMEEGTDVAAGITYTIC